MSRGRRRATAFLTAAVTALALSGCSEWRGLNTLPLPGAQGGGEERSRYRLSCPT